MPKTPEVEISNGGSVVGFTPISEAAQEWFAENVESEGWQWMGKTLWVDHRAAGGLVSGLEAEGLI